MAKIKDIDVEFEPCTVECLGVTIHGLKPTAGREFYHRTDIDDLEKIVEDGKLRPSKDTNVVSLSSNPKHTFGGAVRLIIDKDDLDLEPVCYHSSDEKKIYEAEKKYRDEINPVYMPNEFYSYCKTYPVLYASECEFMSKEPIDLDKVKKIEYWLEDAVGSVSCKRRHPPILNYDGWSKSYEHVKNEIKEAKDIAEKLGVPFEVKSCYKYMEVPCNNIDNNVESSSLLCAVELNDENLEKMSNLENPDYFDRGYISVLFENYKKDADELGRDEVREMWCRC